MENTLIPGKTLIPACLVLPMRAPQSSYNPQGEVICAPSSPEDKDLLQGTHELLGPACRCWIALHRKSSVTCRGRRGQGPKRCSCHGVGQPRQGGSQVELPPFCAHLSATSSAIGVFRENQIT